MVIAFGGLNNRLGIPPYEFLSFAGRMRAKRLFVRDLNQAWYHRGLPGYGDGIDNVAAALKAIVLKRRVDRLVCCGSSAGGYAALIFGTVLGADVVLAFSPQTTLEIDTLGHLEDHRWDEEIETLAEANALDPAWTDLARALPAARWANTNYRVYFDDTHETDRKQAERLEGLPGLRLYRFGRGAHGLVRELREVGALERVLGAAVAPERYDTGRRA